MKVFVKKIKRSTFFSRKDEGKYIVEFSFQLCADDSRHARSTNAGKSNVKLGGNSARFFFRDDLELPHPDLCALAALKIISPYIGSTLVMDRPVSYKMAQAIKRAYPNIAYVNAADVKPRQAISESPAVSFSGGVDSVGVASVLEEGVPLVLLARVFHPDIGPFETWYNTSSNVKTLEAMPARFKKIVVYSDFEFLSTNGHWCIYPDSYAFTIPCILLADKLNLSHILTGDISFAFTGDETIYNKDLTTRHGTLFEAVSLPLEYPCNGLGELGTLRLANHYGLDDIPTSCQYGFFKKPCMKCIKCFRKSLYAWAIFNKPLSDKQLSVFDMCAPVKKLAQDESRNGWKIMPTYKYVFSKIGRKFSGNIGIIQSRAEKINYDVGFVDKIYPGAYNSSSAKNRPKFIVRALERIERIVPYMSQADEQNFKKMDYKKYVSKG
ncbi:DUF6395 domain-containing protein [Microbulbifer sp. TRSA005]|uniref:DUF6395 domain-containing protein n=1 Tax=unclassified Microbulbifer TaxID=2619833 RepID=UPI0040394186